MSEPTSTSTSPLAKLREPFPPNQISKLPKPTRAQTDAVKADFKVGKRCAQCGTWHHPDVVHLDYVGHAAATDRLLDADPRWTWEPVALTPEGLPAFDKNGGLWIRLTVDGVTRIGYGSADGKTGGDAIKEIIGDAIRNAGMRFGMALDLWHKGDLHGHLDEETPAPPAPSALDVAKQQLIGATSADDFKAIWAKLQAGASGVMSKGDYAQLVDFMKHEAKRWAPPRAEPPPAEPKSEPAREERAFAMSEDEIPF